MVDIYERLLLISSRSFKTSACPDCGGSNTEWRTGKSSSCIQVAALLVAKESLKSKFETREDDMCPSSRLSVLELLRSGHDNLMIGELGRLDLLLSGVNI